MELELGRFAVAYFLFFFCFPWVVLEFLWQSPVLKPWRLFLAFRWCECVYLEEFLLRSPTLNVATREIDFVFRVLN